MINPFELRCEYAANPLGIDVAQPRFTWVLESNQRGQMQSAYRILVASSEEKLQSDAGDKWDSGLIASDQSVNSNSRFGFRLDMCTHFAYTWGQ